MTITLPPVSGSAQVISSSLTAAQIMDLAAKELGYVGAGENLTGAEYLDVLPHLNFMLKSWQADGVNLWRETEGSATFTAGQRTVTLEPFVIDVLEARAIQSPSYERPLQRWEIGEYQAIPNKATPGYPTAYYLGKGAAEVTMSVWPVPYQATVINYSYARVIGDVTEATQVLDVPQQWTEAVWVNLAARCATLFGATRLDPAALQVVQMKADMLYGKMLDSDRPASVFMGSVYDRHF